MASTQSTTASSTVFRPIQSPRNSGNSFFPHVTFPQNNSPPMTDPPSTPVHRSEIVANRPIPRLTAPPISLTGGLIQPVCEICFHTCKLPVKFTCFPCLHHSRMHCHSIKRFCYGCARSYLELHLRTSERSSNKRCPYCPLTITLHRLKENDCFEFDFLVMSLDTSRHTCVFEGCEFQGTQNEIQRHLSSCPCAPKRCRGCPDIVLQKDMEHHARICSGRIQCEECNSYVYEQNYDRHLLQHHSMKCCQYCEQIIPENNFQHHLNSECVFQPIECQYCDIVYSGEEEVEHLCQHLQDFQKEDIECLLQSHRLRRKTQEIREKLSRI